MNPRRIEIAILVFTCALVMVVIYVGSATFKNLKVIEAQSEKMYQPNKVLFHLKQLQAEQKDAENAVRTFNLYKKGTYLLSYQNSLELMDADFDSLYFYQRHEPEQLLLLDSLNNFIEKKIIVLNQELSLRNEKNVVNELSKIDKKIDRFTIHAPAVVTEEKTQKKRGFFSRLFGKKEEEVKTADTIIIQPENPGLKELKEEVRKVKNSQLRELEEMKEREIALFEKEDSLTIEIERCLEKIETFQALQLKTIARENVLQSTKTHRLTKTFGGLILVLLFSLIAFSLYYFWKGKLYRTKLKELATQSEKLAETRQHFLSNMSHEMRTPLNAIIGFTDQVLETELNKQQKEQVEIVKHSSQHLLKLVNNLLDKSRIDAGKVVLEKRSFSIKKVFEEVKDLMEVTAKNKGIVLKGKWDGLSGKEVVGDPFVLKQILINLLGNAIKFTTEGSVTLAAKEHISGGKTSLEFSVTDTGIGISSGNQERLFREFEQGDSAVNRKFGGTGLGLWITKKLVEAQNGTIDLKSEQGKGTTVQVSIPYELTADPGVVAEKQAEEKSTLLWSNTKILIVDDEPYNRKLLALMLKKKGAVLLEAASGKEALEMIKNETPDLALIDIHMPDMTGTELAKQIRNNIHSSMIPLIAITADLTTEKETEYQTCGINSCLLKPIGEKELLGSIQKILDHEKL